ncbi:MAG: stage sporulation protein [Clostridia bacterium]|jgi:stage II sporulation protein R|nr:stage sporulation protein [Clostridia bacterium]MDN5321570.1 stage sporulation protein [Clostridia bacterium]
MKKKMMIIIILLFTIFISGSGGPVGEAPGQAQNDLIRLHVLANSDSRDDQALKYKVKDAIVKEIAYKFAKSESIEESRKILINSLPQVEKIAEKTLISLGSNYDAEAQYGRFYFPTKYYGSFSLPAGEYEAVRVVIGEGKGANWWCVLFPPLCFVEIEKDAGNISKVKNGYHLNTPEKFEKNKIRVSFKIVQWFKKSFPILAGIFK